MTHEEPVKAKPILFSEPMIAALSRKLLPKTQTRRIISPQPPEGYHRWGEVMGEYAHWTLTPRQGEKGDPIHRECPYGGWGDYLWVKEAYRLPAFHDARSPREVIEYLSGERPSMQYAPLVDVEGMDLGRYRHARFMPRLFSRFLLQIVSLRAEPVQAITLNDVIAEGVFDPAWTVVDDNWRKSWVGAWESIHGKGAWERNDWVWVIEFKQAEGHHERG